MIARHAIAGLMLCIAPAIARSEPPRSTPERIREAASRGLPLVQRAASRYPEHRKCFSCHHQTLPALAMVTARTRSLAIDDGIFAQQAAFTHRSFTDRIESLQAGEGIGGRAITVAYGLWSLQLADHKPDDTTAAMVTYLIKTQKAEGKWAPQSNRPPLEESHAMCTVLSAYYMQKYQTVEQKSDVAVAVERAQTWLAKAELKVQEDYVARLWGLHLLGGSNLEAARAAVLMRQRDDGGWAQREDMVSDAYATGQTLYVLADSGLPTDSNAFQRGLTWLLNAQRDDGSWLVETHSKPIQVYFDNGDPHGKHQFISTPSSAWALAALLSGLESSR